MGSETIKKFPMQNKTRKGTIATIAMDWQMACVVSQKWIFDVFFSLQLQLHTRTKQWKDNRLVRACSGTGGMSHPRTGEENCKVYGIYEAL